MLVLPPAALLHPLLDHPVQDGGDGVGAHPLQQIQPAAAGTGTPSGAWGSKGTSKSRKILHLKAPPSLYIPQRQAQLSPHALTAHTDALHV